MTDLIISQNGRPLSALRAAFEATLPVSIHHGDGDAARAWIDALCDMECRGYGDVHARIAIKDVAVGDDRCELKLLVDDEGAARMWNMLITERKENG